MNDLIEILFTAIRLTGGVVLVGIVPGYVLTHRLFPNSTIDGLERFYLSTVSSLAISSLLAFTLSRSSPGLTAPSMLMSVVVASLLIGFFGKLPAPTVFIKSRFLNLTKWVTMHRFSLWLALGVGVLFLMGFSAVVRHQGNIPLVALTEFYIQPDILTEQGINYVRDEHFLELPIGITNRNGHQVVYRLDWGHSHTNRSQSVQLIAQQESSAQIENNILIEHSDSWNGIIRIPAAQLTQADYVRLYLFRDQAAEPIAELKIWLTP
jgi:uncharacterized membrane protein